MSLHTMGFVIRVSTWVPLVKQEMLTFSGAYHFVPTFCVDHVARSLVFFCMLTIELSILRFTASSYHFGTVKHFLRR